MLHELQGPKLEAVSAQISRGRNAGYPAPPAQIRTCATNASGSCFESNGPAVCCRAQSEQARFSLPSALCRSHRRLLSLPLSQSPSLHTLRRLASSLFACLFTTMALSDSPFTKLSLFHYSLSSAVVVSPTALNGASRLPCGRHQCMRRVSDSGEPGSHSPSVAVRAAFPITQQGRRSQS